MTTNSRANERSQTDALSCVYVVIGSTGKYSDHQEWPVRAFVDKAAAEAFVGAVTAKAKEAIASRRSVYSIQKGDNPLDPDMQVDYTGVNYYFWTVAMQETK